MKRFFLFLFCILVLLVIQTALIGPWFPVYIYPDLVLMFLVAGVAVIGFNPVWRWAVLAGILFDLFAYSRIGIHVLLFIVALYGISFISRRLLVAERSLGIVLIAIFVLPMTAWERWGFMLLQGHSAFRLSAVSLRGLLISASANVLLFLFALWLVRRLWRRFGPPEYKIVRNG